MNQVDVHPEDLLDKALHTELSAEELRRLELHGRHCRACRIESGVIRDFKEMRQLAGGDEARIERVVSATTNKLGIAEATSRTTIMVRPRRRRRWIGHALAAAVLFVATGAAATLWSYRAFSTHSTSVQAAPKKASPPPAPPPPTVPETETIAAQKPTVSPEPALAVQKPDPIPSASELFSRAGEARRRGNFSQAVKFYTELQQRYPGSRQELTSRVALGRLLLDRMGDANGALVAFDRYLAKQRTGSLAEEARVGQALALTQLGRRSEARNAWLALLREHPDSVHAERARRRVEELR